MALVSRCPLVAEDVMSSTEHHHVREVVAKAQEPGVSRTDDPRVTEIMDRLEQILTSFQAHNLTAILGPSSPFLQPSSRFFPLSPDLISNQCQGWKYGLWEHRLGFTSNLPDFSQEEERTILDDVPLSSHQFLGNFSATEPLSRMRCGSVASSWGLKPKDYCSGPRSAASYVSGLGLLMCQVAIQISVPPGGVRRVKTR